MLGLNPKVASFFGYSQTYHEPNSQKKKKQKILDLGKCKFSIKLGERRNKFKNSSNEILYVLRMILKFKVIPAIINCLIKFPTLVSSLLNWWVDCNIDFF